VTFTKYGRESFRGDATVFPRTDVDDDDAVSMIETTEWRRIFQTVHLSRTCRSNLLLLCAFFARVRREIADGLAFYWTTRRVVPDGFLRSFLIGRVIFLGKRAIKRAFKLATKIRQIMDRQLSIRRSVNARLTRLSRNALRHQIHLLLGIQRKGNNYDTFVPLALISHKNRSRAGEPESRRAENSRQSKDRYEKGVARTRNNFTSRSRRHPSGHPRKMPRKINHQIGCLRGEG